MIPLFIGITTVNLLCLLTAGVLGYGVSYGLESWRTWHQLTGALSAIACVAVHCVVCTYFIATAKWIQHAIQVKKLDPVLASPTRSFRVQAFPAALLAMFSVFICAVLGVATFSGYVSSPVVHLVSAWVAISINVVVAVIEYRAICRNGALVDEILALANRSSTRGV